MSAWIDNNFPLVFLALLDGSVTAFVLALIALGLSLVFGVMRVVNVAHGEFFMLGAVLAWAIRAAIQRLVRAEDGLLKATGDLGLGSAVTCHVVLLVSLGSVIRLGGALGVGNRCEASE